MAKPVSEITDRAKRYRAQKVVTGPRRCAICGVSGVRLDVMHLDGNEANGERANLAYGCRSCNQKLAAAFRRIGAGVPTNQFNPASDDIPTFAQYAWAVSQHEREAHDEFGAIIHATPKWARIKYAKRIAQIKKSRGNPVTKNKPKKRKKKLMKRGSKSLAAWVKSQMKKNAVPKANRKRNPPKRANAKRNPRHTRAVIPRSGSTGWMKAREVNIITKGGKVKEVKVKR